MNSDTNTVCKELMTLVYVFVNTAFLSTATVSIIMLVYRGSLLWRP